MREGATLPKWSPVNVFKRNGLDFHSVGLDYVAWDSKRLTKTRHKVVPTSQTGSDHPWVVVDLKPLGT